MKYKIECQSIKYVKQRHHSLEFIFDTKLIICFTYFQEDAAIHNLHFEPEKHMFGVFDGHGGGEVAKYTKNHFETLLREIPEYQSSDY